MQWENQVLLLPGPTPVPPRVLRAMSIPMINHRGKQFKEILEETTSGVKAIMKTQNHVLMLTSSGTGGMEAAVTNFLSPGDKVLVVSIGSFGDRFMKLCRIFGVQAEALEFPWGTAADPEKVAARLAADVAGEIKAVLVQHNETSTGVLNDLEAISRAKGNHPSLLIVDAISSLAAADLRTDEWQADVVIAGSQKAFMVPPGLAMLSVSPRAWDAAERCTNSSLYFSLKEAKSFLDKGQTPYTPAVSVFYGLQEAVRMMLEEGLENILQRHRFYRDMVRTAARALGLELLADDAVASPAVTAVCVPQGLAPGQITTRLREQFNVIVAGGQGKLSDKIFRIGHLGYVQVTDLFAGLAALELVLRDLGVNVDKGVAVEAAQSVWEARGKA